MLHRDLENYPVFRGYGPQAPEVMCNCLVALSDYTEEMGATRVIPGSHLWDDFEDRGDQAQTIAAVMEKGDALIYSGKLLHGAGENRSNRARRALALAFCPGWLVPEEAYPFVVPMEIARTLSPRAQQLTGFRSFHNAKLGGGSLWQVDYLELADFPRLQSRKSQLRNTEPARRPGVPESVARFSTSYSAKCALRRELHRMSAGTPIPSGHDAGFVNRRAVTWHRAAMG